MKSTCPLQTRPWRAFLKGVAAGVCFVAALTQVEAVWARADMLAPSSRMSDEETRRELIELMSDRALEESTRGFEIPMIHVGGSNGTERRARIGVTPRFLNAIIFEVAGVLRPIERARKNPALRMAVLHDKKAILIYLRAVNQMRMRFEGLSPEWKADSYIADLIERLEIAALELERLRDTTRSFPLPKAAALPIQSAPGAFNQNA